MLHRLSFPKSLIVLEKDLLSLAQPGTGPRALKRRLDVVAFYKDPAENSLKPLLIIECKAADFDDRALSQLLGYNHFLLAPYFAVVSEARSALFFRDGKGWALLHKGLLPYPALIQPRSYAETT